MITAWGFATGQWSVSEFAQKAKTAGYEWAALELDDQETAVYNNALWPEFKTRCEEQSILPGVWFTDGGNVTRTPGDAQFAIAELEGPGDYTGILTAIGEALLPDCSLAVVTNFNIPLTDGQGVPQPANAAPLIAAGFSCLTEAYLGDNPNATPDNLDFLARQCGWPTSQPVFGRWNAPAEMYAPWSDWPGVDYLGENTL